MSQTITVTELHAVPDATVIDVRTPVEFQQVHAIGAYSVPLDTLTEQVMADQVQRAGDRPLYVICKMGGRAAKAIEKFQKAGFDNLVNVAGGTDAWDQAGLPVVRGRKVMSLERQVRIVAGGIVFCGATAAMLTDNIYLAGIPAFVGAGLMFAGITDTCAMGLLIAKMPWNQVRSAG